MNKFRLERSENRFELKEKEVCVWKPPNSTANQMSLAFKNSKEEEIEKYLEIAVNKYSYNLEQALGLLFYNKYDIQKSFSDMSIFVPTPNEWTNEDKIVFEQAFMFHGKNFNKIKQVVSTIIDRIV